MYNYKELEALDEALEYLNRDKEEPVNEGIIISVLAGIGAWILANLLLAAILIGTAVSQNNFQNKMKNDPRFRKLFTQMMDNIIKFLKANEYKKYHKYFKYQKNIDDILDFNGTYISKEKDSSLIHCYPVEIDIHKLFKDKTGTTIESHFKKNQFDAYNDDDFMDIDEFSEAEKAVKELKEYYKELNKKINQEYKNNHISIEVYTYDDTIAPGMNNYLIEIRFKIRNIDIEKLPKEEREKVEELIK